MEDFKRADLSDASKLCRFGSGEWVARNGVRVVIKPITGDGLYGGVFPFEHSRWEADGTKPNNPEYDLISPWPKEKIQIIEHIVKDENGNILATFESRIPFVVYRGISEAL
jgi:hypothetical protein